MSQPPEPFTFFWHGNFSQWAPSPFVLDGVSYGCAEQYMMAEKARRFGDEDALAKILATDEPREQKRLGRSVQGFTVEGWEGLEENGRPFCWNAVWRGSMAKFSRNQHLLAELAATAGTTIVEAAPRDTIWGIGLGAKNPKAQSRATWRGRNWLGEVLTVARDVLLAHPGAAFDSSEALERVKPA